MGSRAAALSHPVCFEHRTPPGHPEQPDRLAAVLSGLEQAGITVQTARPVDDADVLRIHDREYWQALIGSAPGENEAYRPLDPDTGLSPDSIPAARLAAGAACEAVYRVLQQPQRVFCATRPPGHHAEPDRAMGFCLINHIAIAAALALEQPGIRSVAIADFDVHHGNGTQTVAEQRSTISFASSHQSPLYPGTGTSACSRFANVHNAPLPDGAGSTAFRDAWTEQLLPALAGHQPDLLLVSAGFDAHRDDPLATMRLTEDDFHWIGSQLATLADEYAHGRMVAVLEGGYHLPALRDSVTAFMEALR